MKAKLSKTKVAGNAMGGVSAIGAGQNNFVKKKEVDNNPSYSNKVNMPSVAPAMYRPGQADLTPNADLRTSQSSMNMATKKERTGSRSAVRCKEEKSSRITNTSKHIYKPCFSMPAKEKPPRPVEKQDREVYRQTP